MNSIYKYVVLSILCILISSFCNSQNFNSLRNYKNDFNFLASNSKDNNNNIFLVHTFVNLLDSINDIETILNRNNFTDSEIIKIDLENNEIRAIKNYSNDTVYKSLRVVHYNKKNNLIFIVRRNLYLNQDSSSWELLKLNSNLGKVDSVFLYSNINLTSILDIKVDSNSNIFATATYFNGNISYYLIKYDSTGQMIHSLETNHKVTSILELKNKNLLIPNIDANALNIIPTFWEYNQNLELENVYTDSVLRYLGATISENGEDFYFYGTLNSQPPPFSGVVYEYEKITHYNLNEGSQRILWADTITDTTLYLNSNDKIDIFENNIFLAATDVSNYCFPIVQYQNCTNKIIVRSIDAETGNQNWWWHGDGDAQYAVRNVSATPDSGCIVFVHYWNFETKEPNAYDLYYIKFDKNGNIEPLFDTTTSLKPLLFENKITIYPNPANDFLYLNGLIKNNTKFKIYDIAGKLILEKELGKSNRININSLPPNIYFYSLKENSNQIKTGKFLKE